MSQQVSGSTQLMALHDALRVRGIVDTGFRMPVLEKKRIAVLGATGSIGTSCIDVVRHQSDAFEITLLTAHSHWQELSQLAEEFQVQNVVLTGVKPKDLPANAFPSTTQVHFGQEQLTKLVQQDASEFVLSAIVGSAGLHGTWAAIDAGKTVGLANKETLVVAGHLVMERARQQQVAVLPVDSEHNAIFQVLACGERGEVKRIILTASGGPFRTWTQQQLDEVNVEDALAHPTWNMGRKITIDSATMMNKALEVIEARWLFDFAADQIDVVVHPESIVHSLVEYVDGSVIAQLSPPDMKLPIQYALNWPERREGSSPRLDLTKALTLHFEPPDLERFPALALGFEVARRGGSCGAVLNAANEVAVDRFLNGHLQFNDIPRLCRSILDAHHFESEPTLDVVLQFDAWARQEAFRWTPTSFSHSLTSFGC